MPYSEKAYDRLRLVFAVICIVAAASFGVFFWLVIHQQHEITHQTAIIQQQRKETILRNCHDENSRHDHTIKKIKEIVNKLPPARKAIAEAGLKNTFLIINALAPKQNCKKVVAKAIHTPPLKPPLPTVTTS